MMRQYVDPSTSGLWYQALLLLIFTVSLLWSRISIFLRNLFRRAVSLFSRRNGS